MKTRYYLILPIILSLTMAACKQDAEGGVEETAASASQGNTTQVYVVDDDGGVKPAENIETAPVTEKEVATRPTPPVQTKAKVKTTQAPAKVKSAPETIYVETYGAQGKVWGHVTMNGDRGTGTIHDFDENTLSVTVTRHGNELFAVDQNSRQYVFKLKQNKTQE